jgi:hypothetical protein
MTVRPEILAQLARMLGDDALRSAGNEQVRVAADAGFDPLVEALVSETADSDDVHDRDSALQYIDLRLTMFEDVLEPAFLSRLRSALLARLSSW